MKIPPDVLQQKFKEYLVSPIHGPERTIWKEHQKSFRQFWQSKILRNTKSSALSETGDYDPIIKLIDSKARGFNRRTDVAIATVGLRQSMWHRMFNDLVEKKDIKETLNQIFNTASIPDLIRLVDRLADQNERHRNGLTGKRANALNALLVLNEPDQFISCVSLKHRFWILTAFGWGKPDEYNSYGEQVILSNKDVIEGFRRTCGSTGTTREISKFLYSDSIKELWFKDSDEPPEIAAPVADEPFDQSEFVIEKHLEDFLIANWEKTDLGKRYELIEEDGVPVSQQFRTDVGYIDLLVRDRKSKEYVVIELKKGQSSDQTAGQLLRYIGWIRRHLGEGRSVGGIVIASSVDEKLRYAISEIPHASVMIYKLNFTLEPSK
jgi:hypothetical protein